MNCKICSRIIEEEAHYCEISDCPHRGVSELEVQAELLHKHFPTNTYKTLYQYIAKGDTDKVFGEQYTKGETVAQALVAAIIVLKGNVRTGQIQYYEIIKIEKQP